MLKKFLQHLSQAFDAFADVRLAGGAEADAHFVVGTRTGWVFGIAEFAGDVDDVVFQGGLEHF